MAMLTSAAVSAYNWERCQYIFVTLCGRQLESAYRSIVNPIPYHGYNTSIVQSPRACQAAPPRRHLPLPSNLLEPLNLLRLCQFENR